MIWLEKNFQINFEIPHGTDNWSACFSHLHSLGIQISYWAFPVAASIVSISALHAKIYSNTICISTMVASSSNKKYSFIFNNELNFD